MYFFQNAHFTYFNCIMPGTPTLLSVLQVSFLQLGGGLKEVPQGWCIEVTAQNCNWGSPEIDWLSCEQHDIIQLRFRYSFQTKLYIFNATRRSFPVLMAYISRHFGCSGREF